MLVLDPHGDMSYDLLDLIPPSAADRVILFDPVEQIERPFGLNLFDIPDPKRMDVSADWAVTALKKAIASDTSWPMTADRVARHLFAALGAPGRHAAGSAQVPERPGLPHQVLRLHGRSTRHRRSTTGTTSTTRWVTPRDTALSEGAADEAGPILRRLDRYLARRAAQQHPGPAEGEPQHP